jgi:large subunit ribosomal protein L19
MANIIDEIETGLARKTPLPDFQVGDLVDVHVLIKEGEKERVQVFTGTVIRIQNRKNLRATFTVRRIVAGEGVERTFPYHAPTVQDVRVRRKGKVRRAKLFYLRERVGKATRVKERRGLVGKEEVAAQEVGALDTDTEASAEAMEAAPTRGSSQAETTAKVT